MEDTPGVVLTSRTDLNDTFRLSASCVQRLINRALLDDLHDEGSFSEVDDDHLRDGDNGFGDEDNGFGNGDNGSEADRDEEAGESWE